MNAPSRDSVTADLAAHAQTLSIADAPAPVAAVVRQCVLDYLGVTIAGQADPALAPLRAELAEEGAAPQAQVYGDSLRLSIHGAALLNGMASHVLDYDHVNFPLMRHPTVPILPAALALAEAQNLSGVHLMDAFLAGRKPNFQKFRLQAKKELEKYVDGCERDLNAPPSMRLRTKARCRASAGADAIE